MRSSIAENPFFILRMIRPMLEVIQNVSLLNLPDFSALVFSGNVDWDETPIQSLKYSNDVGNRNENSLEGGGR